MQIQRSRQTGSGSRKLHESGSQSPARQAGVGRRSSAGEGFVERVSRARNRNDRDESRTVSTIINEVSK